MGDENVPFGYLEPGRIGSKQDRIVGFAVWGSPELAGGGASEMEASVVKSWTCVGARVPERNHFGPEEAVTRE